MTFCTCGHALAEHVGDGPCSICGCAQPHCHKDKSGDGATTTRMLHWAPPGTATFRSVAVEASGRRCRLEQVTSSRAAARPRLGTGGAR